MFSSALEKMRLAIRLGMANDAHKILEKQKTLNAAWRIEAQFLDLLNFRMPAEAIATDGGVEADIRLLILNGIVLNRKRDPLAALAKLAQANAEARQSQDLDLLLDVLLEQARVYVWLGNSAAAVDFLGESLALAKLPRRAVVLLRIAELYAEVERWVLAQRYVDLALADAAALKGSVYLWQLNALAAQIALENSGSADVPLVLLQKQDEQLPAYLKFRWRILRVQALLQLKKYEAAKIALAEVKNLAELGNFENTVCAVWAAKLEIAQGEYETAIPKLVAARDWFADEDLAVRLVDAKIHLAQALALSGRKLQAAAELDSARHYCTARGLPLQGEKVEMAFASLDLALIPIVENNRSVSEGSWKNRQAYVVLQRLGAGGQANVFRAHDNQRNTTVAIKKLNSTGPVALENLSREVRNASVAALSGVAQILACGQDADGSLYMVQEFIGGTSLREVMKAQSAAEVISHIIELSKTLESLHAKGIVHGDVKPENVMITPDGKTVLVDFGVAQLLGEAPKPGATSRYAPPPSFMRDATWRDSYALGLMLIEASGGTLPARHSSTLDRWFIPTSLRGVIAGLEKHSFYPNLNNDISTLLNPLSRSKRILMSAPHI